MTGPRWWRERESAHRGQARRRSSGHPHGERGAAATELVVLLPALAIIIALLVAGGRIYLAQQAVTDAAAAGARSASVSRTAAEARQNATTSIRSNLATAGVSCRGLVVEVDTTGFAVAVGLPASVSTEVGCTVTLADLVVPGLPGSVDLEAEATSALDTYRGR